ncbi:GL24561 [Drosophila persimilis]|uniref:GL24561 n=1 Tax=Drosophila persimilis TaxID=7234 RepID=B4HBS1_DROPE|nr:GL24561 [Drosophila persimilis]
MPYPGNVDLCPDGPYTFSAAHCQRKDADKGSADSRIPRNQLKWVETELADRCFELLEKPPGPPPPVCKDMGWYQGCIKFIARCNPHLPTSEWKVVKVETTQGPTYQFVLNKEAAIEAAKDELKFGFSAVTVKVYKSNSAAGARPVDNPFEQDAAEIEAPEDYTETDPEGYSTDGTLRRDFEAMCCDDEVEDDLDADITVLLLYSASKRAEHT